MLLVFASIKHWQGVPQSGLTCIILLLFQANIFTEHTEGYRAVSSASRC